MHRSRNYSTNALIRPLSQVAMIGILGIVPQSAGAQVTPPPVLNASDPSLRLWLRSDTLVAAGLSEGSAVTQWVDQSQYGTIMAPRTVSNVNGPLGGFPVEENPHLRFVTINGNNVPTVRFDVTGTAFDTGDPNVDGSGARDRLYQTNNLAPEFDPLDIFDGSSFTSFVVFKPDYTTSLSGGSNDAHGWQSVFAKRGTLASAYDFKIKNLPNFGNFVFVQYDAVEQYHSLADPKPKENVWHVSSMTVVDNPGAMDVDVVDILDDESESAATKMVSLGVGRANGAPLNLIANRNPSVPEPFGIAGFSQNCCGELERFSGNIAEIVIFARTLTAQEYSDVEDYLDAKYFAAPAVGVLGDYNNNSIVDAADYVVWRNGGPLGNEGDSPGVVDQLDYSFWRSRFGAMTGSSTEWVAVPETSSLPLLLVSLLFARRRVLHQREGLDTVKP
jgi:hypothetical protein